MSFLGLLDQVSKTKNINTNPTGVNYTPLKQATVPYSTENIQQMLNDIYDCKQNEEKLKKISNLTQIVSKLTTNNPIKKEVLCRLEELQLSIAKDINLKDNIALKLKDKELKTSLIASILIIKRKDYLTEAERIGYDCKALHEIGSELNTLQAKVKLIKEIAIEQDKLNENSTQDDIYNYENYNSLISKSITNLKIELSNAKTKKIIAKQKKIEAQIEAEKKKLEADKKLEAELTRKYELINDLQKETKNHTQEYRESLFKKSNEELNSLLIRNRNLDTSCQKSIQELTSLDDETLKRYTVHVLQSEKVTHSYLSKYNGLTRKEMASIIDTSLNTYIEQEKTSSDSTAFSKKVIEEAQKIKKDISDSVAVNDALKEKGITDNCIAESLDLKSKISELDVNESKIIESGTMTHSIKILFTKNEDQSIKVQVFNMWSKESYSATAQPVVGVNEFLVSDQDWQSENTTKILNLLYDHQRGTQLREFDNFTKNLKYYLNGTDTQEETVDHIMPQQGGTCAYSSYLGALSGNQLISVEKLQKLITFSLRESIFKKLDSFDLEKTRLSAEDIEVKLKNYLEYLDLLKLLNDKCEEYQIAKKEIDILKQQIPSQPSSPQDILPPIPVY